jgi:predicted GIY-YIG superfamily endonuclease
MEPTPHGIPDGPWQVYIVECRDGSLYTGITNDLPRRCEQHNEGTASRYTRARRPVILRYAESQPSRSSALIRECAVKLLTRKEKEELIHKTEINH